MVNDHLDIPVVVDEDLNEDDEDAEDEDTASSSGSSVEILTASQLSDPNSRMQVVDAANDFIMIASDDEEEYRGPVKTPKK